MNTKTVITTVAVIISMLYGLAFAVFDLTDTTALVGAIALGIMWVVVGMLLRSTAAQEAQPTRTEEPAAR